ncbi:Uncharacterised protein [Prevotella melaninogenica]|jgi:hypothetical protein|uniref:hypothetical protein n=1 Tax=Prevotella TaxID=838 RepID=UPI001957849A|nr:MULTISPECIES: hypothetical protein [Prevotella]VTY06686.1 Uncharacterised protein [Prevotella melaninogenica]
MVEINQRFEEVDKQLQELFAVFNGEIIFPCSYFVGSIITRTRANNQGFMDLIKAKNHICALALIRLQIDNSILLYQAQLVEDPDDFFQYMANGNEAYKYKGNKKMKIDFHERKIVEALNQRYDDIKGLYTTCSGFIHFSSKHISSSYKQEFKKDGLNLYINEHFTVFYSDEDYKTVYNTMLYVNEVVLDLLHYWEKLYLQNVEIALKQSSNPK